MLDLDGIKWACARVAVNTSLFIRHSSWLSPGTQPNHIKSYPCRPSLFSSRVFISERHDGQRPLPLIIRAHGGGLVVNNPSVDDPLARHLADHANCCVVSIDYGKAPQNKFPTALEDVIVQCLAVIDDSNLPLDRSKVILSGSSAGGNLMLAAAQDTRLRPKILGIAAIYPLVDFVPAGAAKMASRPNPLIPDFIGDSHDGLKRLYFDADQPPSLTDPRVSPIYFSTRQSLPSEVLIIGAEHDMFCHEDEAMAERIAAEGNSIRKSTSSGWKATGVEWHKILGQRHAFDAFPEKDAEKEKQRLAAIDAMYSVLCEWVANTCTN